MYVKISVLHRPLFGGGVLKKHVLVRKKIKICSVVYFVDVTILFKKKTYCKTRNEEKIKLFTNMQLFARFFVIFSGLTIFFVWQNYFYLL